MQEAVPVGEGTMIAVLGLKIHEVEDLIKKNDNNKGVCEVANDNADGQVIISGNASSIKFLQELLKEKKIKSIPLKVSAPFHCSLMKPAAEKMKEKIGNTNFKQPSFEIINNVNKREKANFKVKFVNFSYEIIKLKVIIKNGLTNSIGCSLGKKNKSNHLFDPLISVPIIGTKNSNKKDKQNI